MLKRPISCGRSFITPIPFGLGGKKVDWKKVSIRSFMLIGIGRRGSRTLSARTSRPLTTCPGRELVMWYPC